VRHCGLALERRDRAFVCSAGHSFDLARSGYVNLLQPQDRRSTSPGDSKRAVEARAALERAGIGRAVLAAIIDRIMALDLPPEAVVVDLGSGTGEILGQLSARRPIAGVGIDLSAAAAELAARRFPTLTWVVANADRRLPLQDSSVDLVLSIHGRRNPSESARVLTTTGLLCVVLPASDDLIELRALVQGQGVERDRVEPMVAEHQPFFTVVDHLTARERADLDRDALLKLLHGTYRGARLGAATRVNALERTTVTFSSDIVVLRRS
jgi:23S rRNA (guanine745-N1)-methyltransferase